MASLSRFLRPEASRRLLVDEGEFIVDEVSKHWVCYTVPTLIVLAGVVVLLAMPLLGIGWWLATRRPASRARLSHHTQHPVQ